MRRALRSVVLTRDFGEDWWVVEDEWKKIKEIQSNKQTTEKKPKEKIKNKARRGPKPKQKDVFKVTNMQKAKKAKKVKDESYVLSEGEESEDQSDDMSEDS